MAITYTQARTNWNPSAAGGVITDSGYAAGVSQWDFQSDQAIPGTGGFTFMMIQDNVTTYTQGTDFTWASTDPLNQQTATLTWITTSPGVLENVAITFFNLAPYQWNISGTNEWSDVQAGQAEARAVDTAAGAEAQEESYVRYGRTTPATTLETIQGLRITFAAQAADTGFRLVTFETGTGPRNSSEARIFFRGSAFSGGVQSGWVGGGPNFDLFTDGNNFTAEQVADTVFEAQNRQNSPLGSSTLGNALQGQFLRVPGQPTQLDYYLISADPITSVPTVGGGGLTLWGSSALQSITLDASVPLVNASRMVMENNATLNITSGRMLKIGLWNRPRLGALGSTINIEDGGTLQITGSGKRAFWGSASAGNLSNPAILNLTTGSSIQFRDATGDGGSIDGSGANNTFFPEGFQSAQGALRANLTDSTLIDNADGRVFFFYPPTPTDDGAVNNFSYISDKQSGISYLEPNPNCKYLDSFNLTVKGPSSTFLFNGGTATNSTFNRGSTTPIPITDAEKRAFNYNSNAVFYRFFQNQNFGAGEVAQMGLFQPRDLNFTFINPLFPDATGAPVAYGGLTGGFRFASAINNNGNSYDGAVCLANQYNGIYTFGGDPANNQLTNVVESVYYGLPSQTGDLEVAIEGHQQVNTETTGLQTPVQMLTNMRGGAQTHPWLRTTYTNDADGLSNIQYGQDNQLLSASFYEGGVNNNNGFTVAFLRGSGDNQTAGALTFERLPYSDFFIYRRRNGFRPSFRTVPFSAGEVIETIPFDPSLDAFWQLSTQAQLNQRVTDNNFTTGFPVPVVTSTETQVRVVDLYSQDHNRIYTRIEQENNRVKLGDAPRVNDTNVAFSRVLDLVNPTRSLSAETINDASVTLSNLMNLADTTINLEVGDSINKSPFANSISGYATTETNNHVINIVTGGKIVSVDLHSLNGGVDVNGTADGNVEFGDWIVTGDVNINRGHNFARQQIKAANIRLANGISSDFSNCNIEATTAIIPGSATTNFTNSTITANAITNLLGNFSGGSIEAKGNLSSMFIDGTVSNGASLIAGDGVNCNAIENSTMVGLAGQARVGTTATNTQMSAAVNAIIVGDATNVDIIAGGTVTIADNTGGCTISPGVVNGTSVTPTNITAGDSEGLIVQGASAGVIGNTGTTQVGTARDCEITSQGNVTATGTASRSVLGTSTLTSSTGNVTTAAISSTTVNAPNGTGTIGGVATTSDVEVNGDLDVNGAIIGGTFHSETGNIETRTINGATVNATAGNIQTGNTTGNINGSIQNQATLIANGTILINGEANESVATAQGNLNITGNVIGGTYSGADVLVNGTTTGGVNFVVFNASIDARLESAAVTTDVTAVGDITTVDIMGSVLASSANAIFIVGDANNTVLQANDTTRGNITIQGTSVGCPTNLGGNYNISGNSSGNRITGIASDPPTQIVNIGTVDIAASSTNDTIEHVHTVNTWGNVTNSDFGSLTPTSADPLFANRIVEMNFAPQFPIGGTITVYAVGHINLPNVVTGGLYHSNVTVGSDIRQPGTTDAMPDPSVDGRKFEGSTVTGHDIDVYNAFASTFTATGEVDIYGTSSACTIDSPIIRVTGDVTSAAYTISDLATFGGDFQGSIVGSGTGAINITGNIAVGSTVTNQSGSASCAINNGTINGGTVNVTDNIGAINLENGSAATIGSQTGLAATITGVNNVTLTATNLPAAGTISNVSMLNIPTGTTNATYRDVTAESRTAGTIAFTNIDLDTPSNVEFRTAVKGANSTIVNNFFHYSDIAQNRWKWQDNGSETIIIFRPNAGGEETLTFPSLDVLERNGWIVYRATVGGVDYKFIRGNDLGSNAPPINGYSQHSLYVELDGGETVVNPLAGNVLITNNFGFGDKPQHAGETDGTNQGAGQQPLDYYNRGPWNFRVATQAFLITINKPGDGRLEVRYATPTGGESFKYSASGVDGGSITLNETEVAPNSGVTWSYSRATEGFAQFALATVAITNINQTIDVNPPQGAYDSAQSGLINFTGVTTPIAFDGTKFNIRANNFDMENTGEAALSQTFIERMAVWTPTDSPSPLHAMARNNNFQGFQAFFNYEFGVFNYNSTLVTFFSETATTRDLEEVAPFMRPIDVPAIPAREASNNATSLDEFLSVSRTPLVVSASAIGAVVIEDVKRFGNDLAAGPIGDAALGIPPDPEVYPGAGSLK